MTNVESDLLVKVEAREQDIPFLKLLLGNDGVTTDNRLPPESPRKIKEAYDKSHDIRKLEIELYWKRAGYFWAFITTITAIFGLCIKDKDTDYFILSPLVANIGVITSLCFYYVNLGSKYWQQNWENNVDNLEYYISGNLYKIYYSSQTGVKHSVSGVNNELSLVLVVIWFITFIGSYAYISLSSNIIEQNPFLIFFIFNFICRFLFIHTLKIN